ncbi:19603_t:CDS:2, partial [Gigaspora rosea]
NREISPLERCKMVMLGFFFLNHWKNHIQVCAQNYPEFMSVKKNFIASVTFNILTSLSESMILLTIAYRDYYPQYPFTPWMYGSEGCEHFFGLARQVLSDFSFNDLVALTPKIACMYKAYSSGSFRSEREKMTGVGYISHYSDSSIVENLEVLRNWPSDDEIRLAIHYAYEQATALAKDVLGMVISTQIRDPMIILEDEEEDLEIENENEIEQPANLQRFGGLQEAESIFISEAAAEVNTWDKLNELTEIEEGDDFSEGSSQLALILDFTRPSRNHNVEMDIDINTGVVNRMHQISVLVNQRRRHEAYTSQRMERRVAGFSTSTSNNRYSSLISYLSSNESARPGIPRQNRWKMRARFERLNDEARNSVRLVEISTANVNPVHPVMRGGFGIGRANDTIFLFQILALYYKNSNYHSFIESHTNIDELSYISVKVFFQLRYGLFSSISDGGYTIFTHIPPSSFIYYLGEGNFASFDEKLGLLTALGIILFE